MAHERSKLALHGNYYIYIIYITYKGRHSPCLLMNLYLIMHYYNCTATTLSIHFRNIEVESNNGSNLLMLSDQEDGYQKNKMWTHSLIAKRWQNIVPYFSQILTFFSVNLCNNSDQTLFSNTLTFARSFGRCWKPRPMASDFNTSPQLANVNAWKAKFDPYNATY